MKLSYRFKHPTYINLTMVYYSAIKYRNRKTNIRRKAEFRKLNFYRKDRRRYEAETVLRLTPQVPQFKILLLRSYIPMQ